MGEDEIFYKKEKFSLLTSDFFSFSRYNDDEFPQLFRGPIDVKEYELALHLLENDNIFTVHEVAEMLKGSTEGTME